jgi:hypothetical protein
MHLNSLRGMTQCEAGQILMALAAQFLSDQDFVADEHYFDAVFFDGQGGSLDFRCRSVVASHSVQRDLHAQPGLPMG